MPRRLNVLLVEDNEINGPLYISRYSAFFASQGYEAVIEIARCDIAYVREKLSTQIVHVLITDITFGDRDVLGGIALIEDVNRRYPGIFIIGNSSADFGVSRTVGIRMDLFIPKDAMINKEILSDDWYGYEFAKKFRYNTELTIENDALVNAYGKSGGARAEVERLIRQCLFTSHEYDPSFDLSSVKLYPLTRGYSDSRVFRLTTQSANCTFHHIQAVIKVSRVEKAVLELKNFNRYVKWTLPFDWRVDVLGSACGVKYGAVCYSFIDSDTKESQFYDLEHYILSADANKIRYVISTIMNEKARKWYQEDIYGDYESISAHYRGRYYEPYGSDFRKTQRVFERSVRTIEGVTVDNDVVIIPQLKENISLPTRGVLGKTDFKCQTCIGHGDLHARNILVSSQDNGKVVFIDFQQTGRCHVFEDFIVLEYSIRMHYPNESADEIELLRLENRLNDWDNGDLPEKYELIRDIRRRARAHFREEPIVNYVYGALAFGMRLLRETKITGLPRTNLVVAIISSCRFLERQCG